MISKYVASIKAKEFTAEQGVKKYIEKIKSDKHNAVLEVFKDAIDQAKAIDKKIADGKKLGALAGVPIIIKDNILFKNHISSAGSKMLEGYIAPYSASIVEKMIAEDAVIIGRANMDEFAMGSTGEYSAYGATHNGLKMGYVAGGSSSGSTAAVAADLCVASIGTDTGGSIRLPASFNGLYSIKPTYGTVSRYGIIAMASSLDQAGPICKTAEDTEILYNVIRGKDGFDGTLLEYPKEESKFDIKKLKIGYVTDIWKNKESLECPEKYQAVFDFFKSQGAQIKEVSIKNLDLVLPTYYIIVPAEVASNLARYDGVKYTKAAKDCDNINDLYKRTRGELLGSEVKRRIMTGNYVLSSGYFDAYYNKAKKVQAALKQSFLDVFKECDIIITPTATGEAIKLGEKQDPVSMYLMDIFTVPANITGIPAMNVPFAVGKSGMPLGIQIMGKHFSEKLIFETAKYYEAHNGGKK